MIDFHAHVQILFRNVAELREKHRCRPDPLIAWLRASIWRSFERLGYRYLFGRKHLFEKTMEHLLARILLATRAGDVQELLQCLDDSGVERAVLLAVPPVSSNETVLEICRQEKRFIPFVSFADCRNPGQSLESAIKAGGRGIKLHPLLQNLLPGDERFFIAASAASAHRIPLVIHAGGTRRLFRLSGTARVEPQSLRELASTFPKTNIVIAHCGLWEYRDMIAIAATAPNLYLDISFQSASVMGLAVKTVGANRVLLGSDFPMGRIDIILQNMRSAGFSYDQVRAITRENALRLLNE